MFIKMKSGILQNLIWIEDYYQDKHNKNVVVYLFANGVQYKEEYDTEQEALDRISEINISVQDAIPLTKKEIVDELPSENIKENVIYCLKASDERQKEGDIYEEYIYINGSFEQLGVQRMDLENYYSKDIIDDKFAWIEY